MPALRAPPAAAAEVVAAAEALAPATSGPTPPPRHGPPQRRRERQQKSKEPVGDLASEDRNGNPAIAEQKVALCALHGLPLIADRPPEPTADPAADGLTRFLLEIPRFYAKVGRRVHRPMAGTVYPDDARSGAKHRVVPPCYVWVLVAAPELDDVTDEPAAQPQRQD